jgi:putative ABC transport system permease protein
MRDVAYAVRSLIRTPGFTLATVLTLAIGIGAATAIYSVVNTILLKPLPYPGGDRLVQLIEHFPTNVPTRPIMQKGLNYPEYLDWRTRSKTLEDTVAVIPMAQRSVKTPNGAVGLWGLAASANAFELLDVAAMLGRTFTPDDSVVRDVAILSYDTWRRHFHSDPAIAGQSMELRTGGLMAPIPPRTLTIVGVMPPGFAFPTGTYDFYAPIALNPSQRPQVTTLARLAPGASLDAAIQEANTIGGSIRQPWPATGPQLAPGQARFEIQSVKAQAVEAMAPALRVLLAAVVVVLLIVCANVANLLFARGTARQREVAVRLAVGASRARILRQIFVECGVLALAGGALGALAGVGGVMLVKRLTTVEAPGIYRFTLGPSVLPRANEVGVNWELFAIAFAIAAITAVAFGILPALHLSRTNQVQAMGTRAASSGRRESAIRAGLTLAQLALATVMLSGAGLLIHSFMKLSAFDKGYNPADVLAFNLLFPDQYSTARKGETIATLLARFRGNPNVRAAGFARHGLLIGEELYVGAFVPAGRNRDEIKGIRTRSVSDGFLTAMAVPVLAGRDFLPTDDGSAPGAIVINRAAARHYFGDANPVGQIVTWDMGKTQSTMTVVGVVENVRQESATDPIVPEVFVDYRQYLAFHEVDAPDRQNQTAIGFLSFALRTAGDPAALVPVVREVITSVDSSIGIDAIVPLEQLEAGARARERFYAVVLGLFAAVAALLAAIGVYGVLSYAVVQRTQEIGVRMALGARRQQVLGLIMRKGLRLAVAGVTLGVAAAVASARYLESMLFGVQPLDAWTFATVALGFMLLAAIACFLPARRATKVEPVVALRCE